jgi:hypothetical protein
MSSPVLILKIVLSFAFGAASVMTLLDLKPFAKLYSEFKLNRFAMILISLIEITFVVLLFSKTFDFYASIGLAYITTTAIFKHIKIKHPFKKYIPATVLLILSMLLAVLLMKPA